ncbi:MAG: EamA family transporter [Thaumarchaeota archaeon]|nr:EamA family transporter [Nitrososphaerota archaeon]
MQISYLSTIKGRLISTRSGYLLAITAAALTGMIHSLPKQLFSFSSSSTELNPLTFVAIVYLINGVFFTPIKKDSAPLSKLGRKNWIFILAIALAEVSGLVSYFFGLKQSTAINGSILTNGEIIFAVLIALTVFKERLHTREIFPFSAIIIGIIVIPIGYELFQSHLSITDLLMGNILILLSGAFCATDIILCRYVTGTVDPKRITQLTSFAGAAFVLITMATFHVPFQVDLRQLPSIAMLGLFGTGFATFLFLAALKIIGTTRTVLLYSTNFVFGVIFATVFLHESLTIVNILSILLASIGIYLLRNKLGTIEEFINPTQRGYKRGSYKTLCKTCQTNSCCTSFSSPLLFPTDIEKLKTINKYNDKYVQETKIRGKLLKSIKKKKNSECVFWDAKSKKCSIYKNRPFDCMIFPFDIFAINGKYFWVVFSCNPNSDWRWSESYLQTIENSEEFRHVLENIDSYHGHIDSDRSIKNETIEYSVIREVNFNKLYNK